MNSGEKRGGSDPGTVIKNHSSQLDDPWPRCPGPGRNWLGLQTLEPIN